MAKNIIIFSDGTGQEGGSGANSNVYKIFNCIEDRTQRQISFYDRGLGTGINKVTGLTTGIGISKNIIDCYTFIFENYESGDQIYLLGFSRGAATVRSLSGFLHYFGILPKSRPELIKEAYNIYKKYGNTKKMEARARSFVDKHHTMWVEVHFIGCFDTVVSLGLPNKTMSVALNTIPFFKHKFHDLNLSPSIKHAYHALCIDDEREYFLPTLWNEKVLQGQTLEQVWFCGMHSDVGGGYEDSSLSDISLKWMLKKAVKHGLLLYQFDVENIKGNVNGKMHNSREGVGFLYPRALRFWPRKVRKDKPVLHPSVLERTLNVNNLAEPVYKPWVLAEDFVVYEEK